jgi:hypothetical protein
MLEARSLNVYIPRPWREVYEALWRPQDFPRWASGLSGSSLEKHGDHWRAQGPEGPIRIRFTDHHPFGIMDHFVDVGTGEEIYMPMRIVANGAGAEALLTLFRQPDMAAEKFEADAEWVLRDLRALRDLFA